MQRRMNGIFAGEEEFKCIAYWKQSVSHYRLVSLVFFFTFLAFMLPFRLCLQGRPYLLGIHLALF